jgi:hypothetical protein
LGLAGCGEGGLPYPIVYALFVFEDEVVSFVDIDEFEIAVSAAYRLFENVGIFNVYRFERLRVIDSEEVTKVVCEGGGIGGLRTSGVRPFFN